MNYGAAKIFSKVILADKKVKIKLLGDSITHGVGGEGYKQDGESFISGFARNTNGYCWANLLRDYMESSFNCEVINNGCSGVTIEFIIDNFDTLVDTEDDIVICTIGTNNRHQYVVNGPKMEKEDMLTKFYENIIKLNEKFGNAGKDVIFVANIPASAENEMDKADYWRILHMNDIHDAYVKASFACGFPLVDLYSRFLQYCNLKNIALDSLLADGLHPNNAGYDVMFDILLDELGIAKKV